MINQVRLLFGEVPTKLDDFIFASQSVQAEAMKFFVEIYRGNKFAPKTGILWWNIRDGWPLISDAVVDYYFSPKMAYWFLRNVQRNVCVLINDAADGSHPLVATNDTRSAANGTSASATWPRGARFSAAATPSGKMPGRRSPACPK